MVESEGYVILTEVIEEEDGQFAAHCLELGTATCGDTIEEALANLREAIVVHLNALEEVGTRDKVFRERNIVVRPLSTTDVEWPIPISEAVDKIIRPIRQPIPASA